MASITISPVIYRQYEKKDGTIPVRIRITFQRKSRIVSTNIVARPGQLTRNLTVRDRELQKDIDALIDRMQAAANKLDTLSGRELTVDDIVNGITRRMSEDEWFSLEFFGYGRRFSDTLGPSSRTNYNCALHALQEFVGMDEMDISMITSSMMRGFEAFLKKKHGPYARAVSLYTSEIAHIHKEAQKEYNSEEYDRVLIRNPFAFYTPPRQKAAQHRDVDAGLIKTMLSMREGLSGKERIGVDLFLISFGLMGMNTPDIYTCAPPKRCVITYNRTKTRGRRDDGAELHVRIEPQVMRLAAPYLDPSGERAFGFYKDYYRFKYLGQVANAGLLEFERRIGYGKHIVMYSARHTWASAAYSAKIDKSVINDALCHVDPGMKVTDIYIRKDWSVVWDANARVLESVGWV